MIPIQFPEPLFKTKKEGEEHYVFDSLRKTWLLLTEEEWVRQNFVQYLLKVMNYPAALVALEKEIMLGERRKRFDILVYDPDFRPWMMIECKASSVKLSGPVLEQVLRYNISVPVPYLVITNGHFTMGWERTEGQLKKLDRLPPPPSLVKK